MAVCTYDNPATMRRECWQDGELVASYCAMLMHAKHGWPPPPRRFHMGANIGPWKEGQMIGSPDAIPEDCRG